MNSWIFTFVNINGTKLEKLRFLTTKVPLETENRKIQWHLPRKNKQFQQQKYHWRMKIGKNNGTYPGKVSNFNNKSTIGK